jgi:hypothetical protein
MPSSASGFKRKLRLPRLFFAKPSEIVPRDYERPIPHVPWHGITVIVVLIVLFTAQSLATRARSSISRLTFFLFGTYPPALMLRCVGAAEVIDARPRR